MQSWYSASLHVYDKKSNFKRSCNHAMCILCVIVLTNYVDDLTIPYIYIQPLRCGKQQRSYVVVVSMVASSMSSHIHIWEIPWGGGNIVSSLKDEKSSTLQQESPPWDHQMWFLMLCWVCHGFPHERDPMMPFTCMIVDLCHALNPCLARFRESEVAWLAN